MVVYIKKIQFKLWYHQILIFVSSPSVLFLPHVWLSLQLSLFLESLSLFTTDSCRKITELQHVCTLVLKWISIKYQFVKSLNNTHTHKGSLRVSQPYMFPSSKKATIAPCLSIHPTVCMEQPGFHSTGFHEIWGIFLKDCPKNLSVIKMWQEYQVLHKDLCTSMIISRWILLRMNKLITEAHSHNHCWCGKATSISYIKRGFVALDIKLHSTCTILPSLACLALPYFSTLPHKWHDFKKKNLLTIKCVFWFSLELLSETFVILGRTKWHMTINVYLSSCKVLIILVRF